MKTDVLVVGAGPAGASAAIALSSAGYSVVVVDRARFPRSRIGESLPPKVIPLLAILGVDTAVRQAGFIRMAGSTVYQGDGIKTHPFDPSGRLLGYQVDRASFDSILLERARDVGCRVLEGAKVVAPLLGAGGIVEGACVRSPGHNIHSKFVVDASGGSGVLSRALASRRRESIRTLAVSGYWERTQKPLAFSETDTLFEMRPDGWLWSVLLSDGLRNITLGVDAGSVKGSESLRDLYLDRVFRSELVGPLVRSASLATSLTPHDATWSFTERSAGRGFVLAGDAASVIDPMTSHGVYKALRSGILAGAVIRTCLARPERTELALRYYAEEQARWYEKFTSVALTFYRSSPYAEQPFWSSRTRPGVFEGDFSAERLSAGAKWRQVFTDRLRAVGGGELFVRAAPELAVEVRPIAEFGFIELRPALVCPPPKAVCISSRVHGVDVEKIFPLLDGRSVAGVFEAYAERTGAPPSSEQGRQLIDLLLHLIERGAVEFL